MTYTTKATAVRGALLAAAALLAASPASAAVRTAPGEARQGDWLYLTLTRGDSRSSDARGTLLLCDPPRGHARAAEACAELGTADGDIRAIRKKDVFCPMIYAPVTVHARGKWHSRAVEYEETFPNACVLRARTGAVFALDG